MNNVMHASVACVDDQRLDVSGKFTMARYVDSNGGTYAGCYVITFPQKLDYIPIVFLIVEYAGGVKQNYSVTIRLRDSSSVKFQNCKRHVEQGSRSS